MNTVDPATRTLGDVHQPGTMLFQVASRPRFDLYGWVQSNARRAQESLRLDHASPRREQLTIALEVGLNKLLVVRGRSWARATTWYVGVANFARATAGGDV